MIVTIHKAKTALSQLIAQCEAGEDIVLARGNQPVARLVAISPAQPQRRFGALRDVLAVGPEFFEPLPETELSAWED